MHGFSAEFSLAVACCAHMLGMEAAERMEQLSQGVSADAFLAMVRRHRVSGLVSAALADAPADTPDAVRRLLADDTRRIAEANLRAAAQSSRLQRELHRAGVDHLFLKGLPVGKLAYGNPLLKMSWDIDVLVAHDDLLQAAEVLASLGYVPPPVPDLRAWHMRHKETTWTLGDDAPVELHSRLADNRRMIGNIGLASPRQDVQIVPGVCLPTLSGDGLLAYLAVHGASSAWFRLKWIVDFAGLMRGRGAAEISALANCGVELGAGRAMGQALTLAHTLFGSFLPRQIQQDAAIQRLASVALTQLTAHREPTRRLLGTGTIHLSQLLLQPGFSFALNEAARQVCEVTSRAILRRGGGRLDRLCRGPTSLGERAP